MKGTHADCLTQMFQSIFTNIFVSFVKVFFFQYRKYTMTTSIYFTIKSWTKRKKYINSFHGYVNPLDLHTYNSIGIVCSCFRIFSVYTVHCTLHTSALVRSNLCCFWQNSFFSFCMKIVLIQMYQPVRIGMLCVTQLWKFSM